MKLKKIITTLAVIISGLLCISCTNSSGGISIAETDTAIGGYVWDTKNLFLTVGELKNGFNYCVEIAGTTKPVNDDVWNRWFKDESEDLTGKIVVCLRLDLPEVIPEMSEITFEAFTPTSNSENTPVKLNIIDSENTKTKFLLLNPHYDQIEIYLSYFNNNEPKQLKYQVNLIDVNATGQTEIG